MKILKRDIIQSRRRSCVESSTCLYIYEHLKLNQVFFTVRTKRRQTSTFRELRVNVETDERCGFFFFSCLSVGAARVRLQVLVSRR